MLTYVSGNNRVVVHTAGGDRVNQPIVTKRLFSPGNTAREFLAASPPPTDAMLPAAVPRYGELTVPVHHRHPPE